MPKLTLATDKMIAEKTEGIGWMTFNNPARRNALGFAMREAILEILADFESDPNVRVIVMKGAGDKYMPTSRDMITQATKPTKSAITPNPVQMAKKALPIKKSRCDTTMA